MSEAFDVGVPPSGRGCVPPGPAGQVPVDRQQHLRRPLDVRAVLSSVRR